MMMGLWVPFIFPQAGRSLLYQSVKSHRLMTADAPLHLSPKEHQSLGKPAFNVYLQQSTLKLGRLPLPALPLLVRARLCPSDGEYSQPSPASFVLRVFPPPWTPESWTINDPFLDPIFLIAVFFKVLGQTSYYILQGAPFTAFSYQPLSQGGP